MFNLSEGNDFMAFDLKITFVNDNYENNDKTKTKIYYDHQKLINLFEKLQLSIKLVPIVKTGTLNEIMDFNPKFVSVIYKSYGLEPMKDNYAEGVVVKPLHEVQYKYLDKKGIERYDRLIFKYKNPDFNETIKGAKNDNKLNAKKGMPVKINKFMDTFQNYLTIHRIENLVSKLNDDEKITGEMVYDDVMIDLKIDNASDSELISNEVIEENKRRSIGISTGFLHKNKFLPKKYNT